MLVLALTPGMLLQIGEIDPYVYSGYVHDYRQIYEYFGETYYSNRISAIDVSRMATAILGSENGFYFVRYLLLVVATSSIFAIGRRFYDVATGTIAAVLFCFSPWFLRAIAYDYIDGFVIAYLLAALAMLIVPRRRLVLCHGAAGALLALAVNANVFTLALAGSFAPSWYILRRPTGIRRWAWLTGAVAAGFVVTYIVLAASLRAEFPERSWFFERATLGALNYLMIDGAATSYFQPLSQFLLKRHYYIFVPVVLCLAIVTVAVQVRRRGMQGRDSPYLFAASTYLVLMILVYLVNHYGLHHARITRYYYFSYLSVPTFLAVIALVGELTSMVDKRRKAIVLATAVMLYVLTFLLYSPRYEVQTGTMLLWLWAGTSIAGALALFAPAWPTLRLAALLASLVAAPIPFYFSAEEYIDLHSTSRAATEWDVYRASIHLERVIGTMLEPHLGKIRFWYDPKLPQHDTISSLQSTYLWGYSRIPNMPIVDTEFRKRISDARHLVLLGLSKEEIDRGLAAMTAAGVDYRILRRDRSGGAAWSCEFAIVDVSGNAPALAK